MAAMSQVASSTRILQGSSPGAYLPSASSGALSAAMSQMASTTRSLQSHWQTMLTQQGQLVPVEELLDRRMFGNASNETSLMASPVGSGLSVRSSAYELVCALPLTSSEVAALGVLSGWQPVLSWGWLSCTRMWFESPTHDKQPALKHDHRLFSAQRFAYSHLQAVVTIQLLYVTLPASARCKNLSAPLSVIYCG